MKKIFLILAAVLGLCAQQASAEAFLTPDPAKTYAIKHSSGNYLTVDGNYLKINEKGTGPQRFTFELGAVNEEDGAQMYLIKTEEGKYVGFTKNNHYDYVMYAEPDGDYTNFSIWESHEPDCVKFYNYGKGAYMGTDSNSPNSGVYADKTGNDGKDAWMIVEYIEGVDYSFLEAAIANAEAILTDENLQIGDGVGMYPQSAVDELNAAIETAKALLTSDSQAEVNAGRKALQDAVTAFGKTLITFKAEEGAKYYFYHNASGLMMALTNGVAKLQPLGAENEQWEFLPVEGTNCAFSFKTADKFLSLKGGWDTQAVDDNSSDEAKFVLEPYDLANAVYFIGRYSGWGYLAPDELTAGENVYTDKGTGSYSLFTIIKYEEGQLIRLGLDNAINNAESLVAKAVVGEEAGMYPQEAVDALNAAITTAKTAEYTTQEEVDAATAALNDAVEHFKTQAIPAHDLTEINNLIAEAEAFIAAGCDDALVALYLEEAKEIVADADNHTAAEIKKAHDNLKLALESAGWSGIDAVTIDGVAIVTNGGLTLAGLPAGTLVNVYSLDGRLMATAVADGTITFHLVAGRYVVCAAAEGVALTKVVSVR